MHDEPKLPTDPCAPSSPRRAVVRRPGGRPGLVTHLAPALRRLRRRRRRLQRDVAREAGITRGMLSAFENGHRRPSLPSLGRILDALGADLTELHDVLQEVREWGELEAELRAPRGER